MQKEKKKKKRALNKASLIAYETFFYFTQFN